MAEEIGFENGRNSNFQGLVTLTLVGSSHTAYRRASLNDLYLHTKFHSNRRNFLWTDGRTYGHFSPYIIRSTFGSRPNNIFKTLKSDTPLPPVNRTSEIEHHWVMGEKKKISRCSVLSRSHSITVILAMKTTLVLWITMALWPIKESVFRLSGTVRHHCNDQRMDRSGICTQQHVTMSQHVYQGKCKVTVHTLDTAPHCCESPPQRRSGMAGVLKGFQFYHTFICNWNESHLPLPSQL